MKLIQNPEFTHKVEVQTPVDGGFKTESFKARFKVLSRDRVAELQDLPNSDEALFKECLIEATDLTDAAGEELPWSDEVRDLLLNHTPALVALSRTYFQAISKVRQGN